jgi:hypothetical protein
VGRALGDNLAMNTRIGFGSRTSFLRLIFLLSVCGCAASAQQPPDLKIPSTGASNTTWAKKALAAIGAAGESQSQDSSNKHQSTAQQTVGVITRKSLFFPELATNRTPLTSGEKFKLFVDKSISPSTIVGAVGSAAFGQATNRYEGYGQGWDAYGKRVGAAIANSTSTNFLGTFLIPSLLHQDPRHFFTEREGFGRKLEYAFSRQLVTRTDSGHNTFNWSRILSLIGSEAIANTYLPPEERRVGKTFERAGIRFGIGIGTTLLKEYWPMIFKKLGGPHDSSGPSTQP